MPTVPAPETVLRTRFALVVALRSLALIFLALWLASSLREVMADFVYGVSAALVQAGFAVRESPIEPVLLGAVLPAVALVIAIYAPKLALWLVPMPRQGCPFCDHAALPETGTNCPECGQVLPAQLLQDRQPD